MKKLTTTSSNKDWLGALWIMYYMHEDEKVVILIIYVDDLFVIGNHTKRIKWFAGQLINRFKMSQLGGMEFYSPSGIFMTQRGYVCLTFKERGPNECNLVLHQW
jgi:hypothetical protein